MPNSTTSANGQAKTSVAAAKLPLAGGPPGTTVTMRPLLCGEALVPPGFFYRQSGSGLAGPPPLGLAAPPHQWLRCPVGAFVLEHPVAGLMLVDSGLHTTVHAGPRHNFGALNAAFFRTLGTEREQSTVAQLRAFGIEPADVSIVVMTHLHVDHASALSEFPHATVICSDEEWHAATGKLGEWAGYYRSQLHPEGRIATISFTRLRSGPPPFAKTIDLLGDGSVTAVSTPGHSRGHLSVLARLQTREVLLVGDAVYTLQNLAGDILPWRTADDDAYRGSMAAIRAYIEARPGALVIPTHDIDVWERLEYIY